MKIILLLTVLFFIPKFEFNEVGRLSIDLNGNEDTIVLLKTKFDDPGDYHFLRIDWDNNKREFLTDDYGAWIKDKYFTKISKAESDLLAVVEINGKTAIILKEHPFSSLPNKYVIYTFDENGGKQKIFEEHLEKFNFTNNTITGEKPDENWIRHEKTFKLKDSKILQGK